MPGGNAFTPALNARRDADLRRMDSVALAHEAARQAGRTLAQVDQAQRRCTREDALRLVAGGIAAAFLGGYSRTQTRET